MSYLFGAITKVDEYLLETHMTKGFMLFNTFRLSFNFGFLKV